MEIKDATTTSLADDLKELTLERPVTKALKSTEELEQLTVDEQLSDIERAVYLLSSGQEVQRISVITNLPDLLNDSYADCMRRVVPKVREVLHVAQAEMQLVASSAFLQILQKDLVPVQNYAQTFLQTILSSVDSKDPDISSAWLDTLLDVINMLPKEIIKREILSIALEKGQLSQPVQTRLSCCKILGKIATRFEPFVIKKEILPVVQSLCQDVEYEVRGCMCLQLDPVSRGLGLEATKSAILPELVELTSDEESYVRIAGLETVVNILSLVDEDVCRSTLIPLVCKFCQQSLRTEDITLPVVSKLMGRLIHGFNSFLADDSRQWFMDFFRQLCKVGLSEKVNKNKDAEKESPTKEEAPELPDIVELEERLVETRTNCAFNFPAMVMFVGAKSFKSELGQTFSSLCKDPNVQVRKTLSSGFHEIAGLLGTQTTQLLADLIILLNDENTEVLNGVVQHLPETLRSVCGPLTGQAMHEVKQNQISDVIPAILSAEIVIAASNDWRLQEDILGHFACFQHLTNNETIYHKIIPVLFVKLRTARALPVRLAAVRSTLFLTRNLKKLEQRRELIHSLIDDYCNNRSCLKRSLFIDMCEVTMELYSKAFFKEYFFECLLSLHTDPIPNIRYRLCSVLPDLKRLLKLPSDRALNSSLDSCVRRLLIGEKDRDVGEAIKVAVEELDRIPIHMESLRGRIMMEEDLDDKRKEEEEKKLLETEEREQKLEEDNKAAKAEKKPHSKDNSTSKIPTSKKGKTSKQERMSAGVKRTPSTTTTNSSTVSSVKDSSAGKASSKGVTRSGPSGIPAPTSAGPRKLSGTNIATSGPPRRSSVGNEAKPDKTTASRKNSNGNIPSIKSKKSK